MLRLLLGLSALCLFAGTESSPIDISTCPITYFGQTYTSLSVNFDGSSSSLSVCFDATLSNPVDCFKIQGISSDSFTSDIITDVSSFSFGISTDFPHIADPAVCAVKFTFSAAGQFDFYFVNYGSQAAAHVQAAEEQFISATFIFSVQSRNFESVKFTSSGPYTKNVDLTGCRDGGKAYKHTLLMSSDPATCTTTTCLSGLPVPASTCTAPQICLGNNICGTESFCSVIGPAVIDFSGSTGTIPDPCHYTLLKGSELTVTGVFGTRRLTDTAFLTEVIIKTTDSITLKQGGVVDVHSVGIETFSNPPVIHYGVTLTKDSTGVTAVFKDTTGIITELFFDGTLLSITHKVPSSATSYSEGVCTSASSVSSNKDPVLPSPTCGPGTSDPQGDGIDCAAANKRCSDKLKLVSCTKSSTAFLTACADILYCTYPDVDDLYCHFLDAYARSCKVDNWRTAAGCSASVCLSQVCGSNEFCAVAPSGDSACYCQGTFAAPFRASSSYGDNPVCSGKSASVTLVNCLLEEKGVNIPSLHLNKPSCVGDIDPVNKKVTFSFSDTDTCGADISIVDDKVVYKNTIVSPANTGETVTRDDQVSVQFSCAYKQPDIQTLTLNVKDSSVVKVIDAGEWSYVFTLKAFTDDELTSLIDASTDLVLDQKLWLKLEATGVDAGNLALLIDSCWATKEQEPASTLTYPLISDGCANEATVQVTSNGVSLVSIFSFKVFQFVGHEGDVYLHCNTRLCIKPEDCILNCNP